MGFGGQRPNGEVKMESREQSEPKPKAKSKEESVEELTAFAKEIATKCDAVASYALGLSKTLMSKRAKLISVVNSHRSIAEKVRESEKVLAANEKKAQVALQKATQGVRALSDRVAIESAKNMEYEAPLRS